MRYKTWDN